MEIVIIFFLIVLNGVFSMSEIALISARKSRLETAAKKGQKNAKIALDLVNSPNKLLSTVQIGITLISILTGIYSGDKITTNVQLLVEGFKVLKPYAHSISVGIVVVVLTFFSLVLGELLPKRIGLNFPSIAIFNLCEIKSALRISKRVGTFIIGSCFFLLASNGYLHSFIKKNIGRKLFSTI